MSTLVNIVGLSRRFDSGPMFRRRSVQAVRDVSFDLSTGEAVGLVGESGSGKSTIGKMLLGMLPPSSGTIAFDGMSVTGGTRRERMVIRRRVQMVFQDPYSSLDPRRRVGAQIADPLRIHRLGAPAERHDRVLELLQQVGLRPEHAGRFPHEFSGGQRQRLSIARALAPSPDLLIADEAVSALDVSVQAQVLAVLRDLRDRLGVALLFISHDLPVVRSLCDRIVVLYLGRVMETGSTTEIFTRPRHPYTQALLSAAPRIGQQKKKRIILGGDPPSPANPPSGCVFRTRCPMALPICADAVPAQRRINSSHSFACVRDDTEMSTP